MAKTKLGFERLKNVNSAILLMRIKEIEQAILSGKFQGKMLKIAKKAYCDHLTRYRYELGLKKYDYNINQLVFPEMLRHMGITPIQDMMNLKPKSKSKSKSKKAS